MAETLPNLILTDADRLPAPDRIGRERLLGGMWPRSIAVWLTGLWVVLFIVRPWDQLIPELGEWHFERFYAITVIIFVLYRGLFRLTDSWQTVGVLAFLLAVTVSWLFAVEPSEGSDVLYTYATLVVLYFVLISVIRTPYHLVFIAICYVAGMAAYLLKSEYEFFVHGAHVYRMGLRRLIGTETAYGNPNSVAASTVLTLPIAWFLWRVRKTITGTWPGRWRTLFSLSLVGYALLAISALVLTNSRSGIVTFTAFVLAIAISTGKLSTRLYGLGAAILFIAVVWSVMPEENRNRIRTIWDPDAGPATAEVSAQGRIEGLKASMAIFKKHPATGIGVGNFVSYREANVDGVALQPHNMVGQMLAETGLVGTVAFLFLVGPLLVNCRRVRQAAKGRPEPLLDVLSKLASACVLSLALLFLSGLFGHNLLRFNWLWLAAFGLLCRTFAEAVAREKHAVVQHYGAVGI